MKRLIILFYTIVQATRFEVSCENRALENMIDFYDVDVLSNDFIGNSESKGKVRNGIDRNENIAVCCNEDSEGMLIAHEDCDKYYKCANGVPILFNCPGILVYNPLINVCDWPENVNCNNREILDTSNEEEKNEDSEKLEIESEENKDDIVDDIGNDSNENIKENGSSEEITICAEKDSDGMLIAHENCHKFYKCSHGIPIVFNCYGSLVYNVETEQCDWPQYVDCGNRETFDNSNEDEENQESEGGEIDSGEIKDETDNEAATICSNDNSDGILIAHEICGKFYKCANGVPVVFKCYGTLVFNPETEQCDWPDNVNCVSQEILDDSNEDEENQESEGKERESEENYEENDDSENTDDSEENNNSDCDNNNEGDICAGEDSDGILLAHKNCGNFYKCVNEVPVTFKCYGILLFNIHTGKCDWPKNVDCGDRKIFGDTSKDNLKKIGEVEVNVSLDL